MRVLVTGATGFVGRWLVAELEGSGHDVVRAPGARALDIADARAVLELVERERPDAIVHLAAVAFGPDAVEDPIRAIRTNIGGAVAIGEAALATGAVPVLHVSTSEVYRTSTTIRAPIREDAPLGPRQPYGLTKAGAEAILLAMHTQRDLPVAIARSFNHTGPGQRDVFAVPAFARRVVAARAARRPSIPAGNVDVERDLSDVRDVVRAYRLLLEMLTGGQLDGQPPIFNVASGRPVAMRDVIGRLAASAGVELEIEVDPTLVRPDDPPFIVGDAERLRAVTGWTPTIDLAVTLGDVLEDQANRWMAGAAGSE